MSGSDQERAERRGKCRSAFDALRPTIGSPFVADGLEITIFDLWLEDQGERKALGRIGKEHHHPLGDILCLTFKAVVAAGPRAGEVLHRPMNGVLRLPVPPVRHKGSDDPLAACQQIIADAVEGFL